MNRFNILFGIFLFLVGLRAVQVLQALAFSIEGQNYLFLAAGALMGVGLATIYEETTR